MFNFSKPKTKETVQPAQPAPPTTTIATDTAFEGTIVTKHQVVVEGNFEGSIDAGELLIREKASVKGSVKCTVLVNKGIVIGPVTAERVLMEPTARIEGDLSYGRMVMRDGAFVGGKMMKISSVTNPDAPMPAIDGNMKVVNIAAAR